MESVFFCMTTKDFRTVIRYAFCSLMFVQYPALKELQFPRASHSEFDYTLQV